MNCSYWVVILLLSPEARFHWQTKHHMASPPPPWMSQWHYFGKKLFGDAPLLKAFRPSVATCASIIDLYLLTNRFSSPACIIFSYRSEPLKRPRFETWLVLNCKHWLETRVSPSCSFSSFSISCPSSPMAPPLFLWGCHDWLSSGSHEHDQEEESC